jgi:hypothetical protein
MSLSLKSLGFGALLVTSGALGAELTTLWRSELSPYSKKDQAVYRTAVCPDGSTFHFDGLGGVIRTIPSGSVVWSGHVPALYQTIALTCDARGDLIALNTRVLTTWRWNGSSLNQTAGRSMVQHRLVPSKIVSTPYGLFVLGRKYGKLSDPFPVLHRLDAATGALTALATGPAPREFAGEQVLAGMAFQMGFIAWNPESAALILALASPFELRQFDPVSGAPMSPPTRPSDSFHPLRMRNAAGYSADWQDRIMWMTYAAGAGLVAQTIESDDNGRLRSFLSVIDPQTLKMTARIAMKGTGVTGYLQGADAAGTLYFQAVGPSSGVSLLAVRLIP